MMWLSRRSRPASGEIDAVEVRVLDIAAFEYIVGGILSKDTVASRRVDKDIYYPDPEDSGVAVSGNSPRRPGSRSRHRCYVDDQSRGYA